MDCGYIYILGIEGETRPIKIGYTRNLSGRLSDFQIAHYQTIVYHHFEFVNNCRVIEADLHSHFAGYHIRGEWYDISAREAVSVLREILSCY